MADEPLVPPKSIPVYRGDVAAQLLNEIAALFRDAQLLQSLAKRLDEYRAKFPERHEHLRRFVEDAVDEP